LRTDGIERLPAELAARFIACRTLAGTLTFSEVQAARVRKELAGRSGIVEKQMFGGIAPSAYTGRT